MTLDDTTWYFSSVLGLKIYVLLWLIMDMFFS